MTREIDLEDDELPVVKAMLDYLYNGDYDDQSDNREEETEYPSGISKESMGGSAFMEKEPEEGKCRPPCSFQSIVDGLEQLC